MALQIHKKQTLFAKTQKLKLKEIHKIILKEQLREELKLKVRRYGS